MEAIAIVSATEWKIKKVIASFYLTILTCFLTIASLHLVILTLFLRIARYKVRIVWYTVAIACYKVRIARYKVRIGCYKVRIARYKVRIACCKVKLQLSHSTKRVPFPHCNFPNFHIEQTFFFFYLQLKGYVNLSKNIFSHLGHKILNNIILFIQARESFFYHPVTDKMCASRVVEQEI